MTALKNDQKNCLINLLKFKCKNKFLEATMLTRQENIQDYFKALDRSKKTYYEKYKTILEHYKKVINEDTEIEKREAKSGKQPKNQNQEFPEISASETVNNTFLECQRQEEQARSERDLVIQENSKKLMLLHKTVKIKIIPRKQN